MAGLSLSKKLGYGLGHVLNDLCASMWFTYLLLFFHQVLYFNNNYSGVILLVGQLADGVSTTLVGGLCDKPDQTWLCQRYGQKKSWHLVGTVCVALSFPFIFLPCLGCQTSDEWAQLIYYSAFAVIFQFGWASVQISHLALIPQLTDCQDERTGLTAIRYSMTVVSNISVFLIAWAFFGMSGEKQLSGEDANSFRNIAASVLGLGLLTSAAFHLTVGESVTEIPSGYSEINGEPVERELVQPMGPRDWAGEPQFYQVAGVYMSTRLFVNLSQAYLPLYLQSSLELSSKYVAIIPLVMYSASFIASRLMKPLNRRAGRKVSYLLGAALGLAACGWIYYGGDERGRADRWFKHYGIFIAAGLLGVAGSTVLITSLSLTAELIGSNTESSAFVYGAMSFTDKVSNGLAVMVIQHFIPCLKCCPECKWYFRDVLFYATGGAALLGAACLLSLGPVQVGRRWRDRAGAGAGAGAGLQARLSWLLPAALPDTETEPLLAADRGHANYT